MASEVAKFLIPTIGITYFTSYMTYMCGITKGKADMYNNILHEYNLIPKDNKHPQYEVRLASLIKNTVKETGIDYSEHLG